MVEKTLHTLLEEDAQERHRQDRLEAELACLHGRRRDVRRRIADRIRLDGETTGDRTLDFVEAFCDGRQTDYDRLKTLERRIAQAQGDLVLIYYRHVGAPASFSGHPPISWMLGPLTERQIRLHIHGEHVGEVELPLARFLQYSPRSGRVNGPHVGPVRDDVGLQHTVVRFDAAPQQMPTEPTEDGVGYVVAGDQHVQDALVYLGVPRGWSSLEEFLSWAIQQLDVLDCSAAHEDT